MGKKNSKIQQEATPTLAQYLAQRAQQVRDSAAFELSHQDSPDIPVLPRVSDNTIAYWDARFGTPDSTLIQKYGVEPNPETCIYTATTKYGDED